MAGADNSEAKTARPIRPQRAAALAKAEAPAAEPMASSFAQASELLMNTARAIYETQAEAVREQAEDMARIWRSMASDDSRADALVAVSEQVFKGAERLFVSSQKTGDLVRDFGWRLPALYADNALQLVAKLQSSLPKPLDEGA
jgi:hypothetical protein